jgi:hypothetical protein
MATARALAPLPAFTVLAPWSARISDTLSPWHREHPLQPDEVRALKAYVNSRECQKSVRAVKKSPRSPCGVAEGPISLAGVGHDGWGSPRC